MPMPTMMVGEKEKSSKGDSLSSPKKPAAKAHEEDRRTKQSKANNSGAKVVQNKALQTSPTGNPTKPQSRPYVPKHS
jgi:hypothetical protein